MAADLYTTLFGASWVDSMATAQRGRQEAAGRQQRSHKATGKASVRDITKAAHGSKAAVFKRIRAGGCKGPKALATQLSYINDKAYAVFQSGPLTNEGTLILDEEGKADLVQGWSEQWRGSSKLGFTSHMLLSFPPETNPEIVKAVALDWTEHFFDEGLYGDRWQYVVAIHTDRQHPHAHIILNNRGEDHGTWFSCWEKGVMSPQLMREKQAEFAETYGLQLDATTRLERGIFAKPASLEEIYLAKAEGRTAQEIALTAAQLKQAKMAVYEFSKEYKSVAESMKRLDYVAMAKAVEQMADALQDSQPWAATAERILSMKDLNDYSKLTVAEGIGIASKALTALLDRSEELEGRERIEFELKVVPIIATLSTMTGDAEMQTAYNTDLSYSYPPAMTPEELATLTANPDFLKGAAKFGLDPAEILARYELGGTTNEGLAQLWIDRDLSNVYENVMQTSPDVATAGDRQIALTQIDAFYLALQEQVAEVTLDNRADLTVVEYTGPLGQRLLNLAEQLDNSALLPNEEEKIGKELASELNQALGIEGLASIRAGETHALEGVLPNLDDRLQVVSEYLTFVHELMEPENQQIEQSLGRVTKELQQVRALSLELDDEMGL